MSAVATVAFSCAVPERERDLPTLGRDPCATTIIRLFSSRPSSLITARHSSPN
jgi:hypothetical protein